MRKFQPYRGGNDLLWSLNELCNTCKHETLVAVPMGIGRTWVRTFDVTGGEATLLPTPIWDRAKNEVVMAVIGPGAQLNYDLDVAMDVCFDDIGALGGKPALVLLNRLIDRVTQGIALIALEARRLGYVK
jgi:hypothetical protein